MKKYIYIGAEWCGQCKFLKPKFEDFCKKNNLNYKILDADKDEAIVEKYEIRNIPFIVVEENEKVIEKGLAMNILKNMEASHV